jgi:hypothetical protein
LKKTATVAQIAATATIISSNGRCILRRAIDPPDEELFRLTEYLQLFRQDDALVATLGSSISIEGSREIDALFFVGFCSWIARLTNGESWHRIIILFRSTIFR